MPEMYNLTVNGNHPLIGKIIAEKSDKKKSNLAQQALDLALLSQGLLRGKKLTNFISRSINLID
ncbi:MAG: molecular chaperone HtpG [Flavobacteriales bacterium]